MWEISYMKLYEAIEYAINNDGLEIICENRFTNYLADLRAFKRLR